MQVQLSALLTDTAAPPSYLELVSKSEDAVLKQMQAGHPAS